MSVALSVAFTGLCALITGGNSIPGEVLLVDAKGVGEVRGVILPEHAPTLVVSLRELANAESSNPTRVVSAGPGAGSASEQIGIWDLTGAEVRIRAQGAPAGGVRSFVRADSPWTGVPENVADPASWRDTRYLPHMNLLAKDGRVDPSLVGSIESAASRLPRQVAARVFLDGGLIEGSIPSQESFRDDVFEFPSDGGEEPLRQALTDTVQWTLESDAAAIVIDITPVDGGPARRLLLGPNASPHRVFISNLPSANPTTAHHHAMNEEEMSAVHFGAYYKLLKNTPVHQPIPQVWRTQKGTGFVDMGFCPNAIFARE